MSGDLPSGPLEPWGEPDYTPDRYALVNAFTVLKVRAQLLNRLIFTASADEQALLIASADELYAAILRMEPILLAILRAMDEKER